MINNNQYLLIKSALVFSPTSEWHRNEVDILITPSGKIESIGPDISHDDARVIDAAGYCAMPGFVDIGALCGEPGNELSETYESLSSAAKIGGYQKVMVLSNYLNPYEQGSDVKNVSLEGQSQGVELQAIGRISLANKQDQLAEIFDMSQHGVHLFSDGLNQQRSLAFLIKALQYTKSLNVRLMFIPGYMGINGQAQVNESKLSASLGLNGMPKVIEVDEVNKIINAVRYTGSRALIHMISCEESIALIEQAKAEGLDIHATVSSLHLKYTEQDIVGFNPNFKIFPPLRGDDDRQALIQGLKDGNVDFVVSAHHPVQKEEKDRPFADAPFGSINIQTSLYTLCEAIPEMSFDQLYQWKIAGPGQYFGRENSILVNDWASFSLISLDKKTEFSISDLKSLSLNSIVQSGSRSGQIIFNINQNKYFLKD